MTISNAWPPNYDEIARAFKIKGRTSIVFTYGQTIYNPGGGELPQHLIEHEQVHAEQQGGKPAHWWDRYLRDPEFRLEQELEAYRAQYRYLKANHNRAYRKSELSRISKDLSGEMYGKIVTKERAKELISEGVE